MINPSDSTSVVKEQIEDAVALAGYSAPTSWSDATDKINGTAGQFERDQIADGMNGGLARDRINALFGGPVWAPEGAQLTIDFAANKAWTRNSAVTDSVDAVSLTRAGEVLMLGPDGYQSFPANTLARIDGIGAQVVPARTNKCTNWNANPTDLTGLIKTGDAAATLTVVDDSAELAAADLGGVCTSGMVYKLDNSAGTTTASVTFLGSNVAAAPHVSSLFVRREGATICNFGMTGTTVRTIIPVGTTDYTRLTCYDPSASGNMQIAAQAGNVVYFILNQLEEGSYASPPIITSGAAVSRPGDILSASVPDGGRAFVFEFDLLEPVAGEAARYLLNWSDGSGNNRYSFTLPATGVPTLDVGNGGYVGGRAGPAISLGRNTFFGVAAPNFIQLGRVGTSDGASRTDLVGAGPINRLGFGGSGNNTSVNSFIHARRFTERSVTDFATPADAFAWAKSIAQGWAS